MAAGLQRKRYQLNIVELIGHKPECEVHLVPTARICCSMLWDLPSRARLIARCPAGLYRSMIPSAAGKKQHAVNQM